MSEAEELLVTGQCRDCVGRLLGACRGDACRVERRCLIEEAEARAAQLDHTLSRFVKLKDRPIWSARCTRCGRRAVIQIDPELHEPMVFGDATRVSCHDSTRAEQLAL